MLRHIEFRGTTFYEDEDGVEQTFSFDGSVDSYYSNISTLGIDGLCNTIYRETVKLAACKYHIEPPDIKMTIFQIVKEDNH